MLQDDNKKTQLVGRADDFSCDGKSSGTANWAIDRCRTAIERIDRGYSQGCSWLKWSKYRYSGLWLLLILTRWRQASARILRSPSRAQ
jgi:hypothetical protein